MAVLDKNIQDQIDQLRFEADDYFIDNKKKYYELKKESWSLYPEPKYNWNESYSLAKDIFDSYLFDREFNKATKWLNEMITINNNLHLMDDDCLFSQGKFQFDNKNYTEAFDKFIEVVKEAGMRYFEDEDPKYKDFYLHPEKYIEN